MPHKRAKRSVREKEHSQSSLNLPPGSRHTIDHEDVPKGAARILNAAKVQEEFRERKRKSTEDADTGSQGEVVRKKRRKGQEDKTREETKTVMRIQPGEPMAHFNRRVEDSMRGTMRTAMKNSSAIARKSRKEEMDMRSKKTLPTPTPVTPSLKQRSATPEESVSNRKTNMPDPVGKVKDFERLSTSAPRRLNDIVQAPPELNKLPRGAKSKVSRPPSKAEGATLRQGALSMAQKAMLEEERIKAVNMYREMKKAKAGG